MVIHIGAEKLSHVANCEICKFRIELVLKGVKPSKAVYESKKYFKGE